MTRSRLVVLISFVVVALGVVAGVGAIVLDPARGTIGPLPAEGLSLPADSRFVVGLDMKRFTASPFYEKYASHGPGRLSSLKDLEERTGIDPARDVDQLIIAGSGPGRPENGVVLVLGRFDQYKLGRVIETQKKGATSKKHNGATVYMFNEGQASAGAVAFLDNDLVVMGTQKSVEAVIDSRARGDAPLKSNAALVALLRQVKPGSTFWMVGDQSLMAEMPKSLPGSGSASVQLPPVKTLIVTGELEPMIAIEVTGEAADEASARNLADVVRGATALAALQANQRPELKELASAVNVTTEATSVHVNARVPYELLESLHPRPRSAEGPAGK